MTPPRAYSGPWSYGYWWWSDEFAGETAWFAWGYGGQFIFVFDALELVVVTTSQWWGTQAAIDRTYADIWDVLETYIVPAAAP